MITFLEIFPGICSAIYKITMWILLIAAIKYLNRHWKMWYNEPEPRRIIVIMYCYLSLYIIYNIILAAAPKQERKEVSDEI